MSEKALVSICTLTYNHAPYLKDYFDGILKQKTDFKYEVIINDDCSTDGTKEILLEYEQKYPDIIKPVIQPENQYSKGDRGFFLKYCFPRCNGKYVAFCEGDDCWTDSYKLQKQVDYLESHPECVLVHTDLSVQDVNTGEMEHFKWKKQKNYNQIKRDWGEKLVSLILQGKYSVQTLTVCARMDSIRQVHNKYPEMEDKNLLMGDTPLWMALAKKGTFHLIPEETACYHVISESATHSKNYSNVINFYVSCLYMVEKFAARFDVSDKDKDAAIQTYIYFLLKDVYTDKREFRREVKERILKDRTLCISNKLLLCTENSNIVIKKVIIFFVKAMKRIAQRLEYRKAKYFGIV